MANEKINKLVDPDIHLAKVKRYNRLRSVIEKLSKLTFKKETINNIILRFIPCLKLTDKDCGGLPFYSRSYGSAKTNRDHCLLTLISMLTQVYWDVADGSCTSEALEEFDVNLEVAENIVKLGIDKFRVAGKIPDFRLLTKPQLAAIQDAEDAAELARLEAENEATLAAVDSGEQKRVADAAEAKELMDVDLGESQGEVGSEQLGPDDNEKTPKDGGGTSSEANAGCTQNCDTCNPACGGNADVEADQLSVEDADACVGDCDNCVDKVCELDDEEADVRAADIDAGLAGDDICEGGYTEPEIPPMPEDEGDSQAEVLG